MSDKFFPERLFESGFTDLVSVIPPGAQLSPSSKIPQAQLGKIPGRRGPAGLWSGYNWRIHEPSIDDVRSWCLAGANVGLRANRFPGVDIDCSNAETAQTIENLALARLGTAPIRVGKAPKRLLMYRTNEPFSRMRLWINMPSGEKHLVEILGEGQQFLVYGTHPATGRAYEWLQDPNTMPIPLITREQAIAFLDELEQCINMLGTGVVVREGDGRPITRTAAADQQGLLAPSLELLAEAVGQIPNKNELFPSRTDYLRIGYAIKAAAGSEHDDEGFELFAEWAGKWDGGVNEPDVVRDDWRRMNGEKAVGWSFLAELARGYGFNDAALDFDVTAEAPAEAEMRAPLYSDQWLAETVVDKTIGTLRFVPQKGTWLVWENSRWRIDAELQAEDVIKRALRDIADKVARQGVTPKEQKEALKLANQICSAGKATAVAQLIRSDRAIAVSMESLDHNAWILNTPAGIVDLTTGKLHAPDPDALATKITAVPPDFAGACPEWQRFLAEATGGDRELERYLQRLCGYALTGSTREQHLTFIYGDGGNGKSVLLDAVGGVLGDYAHVAAMDTFTASYGEKHSTDIAELKGARLVTASESSAGKRWDETRVKSLTGGEAVKARFMRQDNFTYRPQFKLVFAGNHKPEIRDVGVSMRRRIQMVPFTVTPAKVDKELGTKLRDEYPAILAWMIEGCLAWQQDGLNPPPAVKVATDDYFDTEDAVGRWMRESVVHEEGATVTTAELFQSWREWAGQNNEYVGSTKRFSEALKSRNMQRWQDSKTRRMGFAGIRLEDRQEVSFGL